MTCTCGAPEQCERHEFMIPRGPHGLLVSVKDDYDIGRPEYIDGPLMRPKPKILRPGQRVRASKIGEYGITHPLTLSLLGQRFLEVWPHAGKWGRVVGFQGDRLYMVKFEDDGKVVGFYANELEPEKEPGPEEDEGDEG